MNQACKYAADYALNELNAGTNVINHASYSEAERLRNYTSTASNKANQNTKKALTNVLNGSTKKNIFKTNFEQDIKNQEEISYVLGKMNFFN